MVEFFWKIGWNCLISERVRSVFSRGRDRSGGGNETARGAHRRGKNGVARETEVGRGVQGTDTDQRVEGVQKYRGQTGAKGQRLHIARWVDTFFSFLSLRFKKFPPDFPQSDEEEEIRTVSLPFSIFHVLFFFLPLRLRYLRTLLSPTISNFVVVYIPLSLRNFGN